MNNLDRVVPEALCSVRPRPGFEQQLRAELFGGAFLGRSVRDTRRRIRAGWAVAGAVAGVVSTTGLVYWGHIRNRRSA